MKTQQKINKDAWYFGTDAQKLIGIKSRQYVPKYIKEGTLNAIPIRAKSKNATRYLIKGEWILSFIERQKKGLIKGQKYTKKELKHTLNEAVKYCNEHNIKTVNELIKHIKKINDEN